MRDQSMTLANSRSPRICRATNTGSRTCCCRPRFSGAISTTRSTTPIAARSRRGSNGKRVGVRAYSQTTGVASTRVPRRRLRRDLQSITWVTFEDPHVWSISGAAERREGARGEESQTDAAGRRDRRRDLGDVAADGPDHTSDSGSGGGGPTLGADAWRRSDQPSRRRPPVDRGIQAGRDSRGLSRAQESRAAAALPTGIDDPVRFAYAHSQSLDQMVVYAHQQGLISRRFTAEELFGTLCASWAQQRSELTWQLSRPL